GPSDGLLRFKVMKDEKFLYLLTLISDDQWVIDDPAQKDLLYLYLEDPEGGQNLVVFSPGNNKMTVEGKGAITIKDIGVTKHFQDSLLMTEFKIPITRLIKKDHSVRINIGFRDQDNIPEKQFSTIFWKPIWGSQSDYKNSGTFLLK
ncbi:MAG TPA: hypothetical protein VEV15_13765, partial [Flavisolibacter sp.]|nr:hypothetical protein [Flavisolibacter sp.]